MVRLRLTWQGCVDMARLDCRCKGGLTWQGWCWGQHRKARIEVEGAVDMAVDVACGLWMKNVADRLLVVPHQSFASSRGVRVEARCDSFCDTPCGLALGFCHPPHPSTLFETIPTSLNEGSGM